MNKRIKENKQAFTDFVDKMAAKWRLNIRPNIPSRVEEGESTESILRDLVAMPTVTGNNEVNHEALNYVERFLSERGMHVKRHEWNGVESLVATTHRTKTPTVFLAGHMDVVTAPDRLFELTEQDGKYFGRGVMDMKSAIAAYLGVVRDLNGHLADYDFGIMITTDEEIGGFDGAKRLAAAGYGAKVMVLPDGGNNWNMERFAKGIWFLTIEAHGRSAHGSRPWEGDNAVEKLLAALQEIRALFPHEQHAEGNTVNIGIVQGGELINLIPSSATASIDFRFASLQEMRAMQRKIKKILDAHKLTYTTEVDAEPVDNDVKNPLVQTYAAIAGEITGKPVDWIVSMAGHDGRWFVKGGTALAVGYPTGGNHHGHEEWISKESLSQMEQLFSTFLEQTAKKHPSA